MDPMGYKQFFFKYPCETHFFLAIQRGWFHPVYFCDTLFKENWSKLINIQFYKLGLTSQDSPPWVWCFFRRGIPWKKKSGTSRWKRYRFIQIDIGWTYAISAFLWKTHRPLRFLQTKICENPHLNECLVSSSGQIVPMSKVLGFVKVSY